VREHLVVVREVARQPQRDRSEAGRLRRQLQMRSVCAAHDQRQLPKRRIPQAVVLQKGIKAAVFPLMREMHVRDVIGYGVLLLRRA